MDAELLYRNERVHTALSGPAALDDEQVELFHRVGFVAVENLYTEAEVASAKQALSELIASPLVEQMHVDMERVSHDRELAPSEREPFVRKIMWFTKHEPRLHAMCFAPRLIS